MASHTSKAFLCLGQINVLGYGFQKSVNRVTYATALSVNSSLRNNGLPEGNSRGSRGRKTRRDVGAPRTEKMPLDQDWTAVYPAATPFRANAVPLPVRMGYPVKRGVPAEKKGNLELIKIPNFLHLTPAAIKKHCKALKPFCTEWPAALETDAKCDEHFPIKVESRDYVSAGLSLRNPLARIVHLTKTEAWEAEKTVADMEEYSWENSPSQKNILDMLLRMTVVGEGEGKEVQEQLLGRREVQEYKDSVTRLKNEGESESTILQYKEAVKKVLNL
uniref:Mitochondrial ribosomal protein S35 n=1 Tax=Mastacembelus armatus TaxID=205130 RepID=A0A3Q3N393_9TELE